VLEDTNDIAFTAVTVGEARRRRPGVWFRLGLGGITGTRTSRGPTGVLVRPEDAVAVAMRSCACYIDGGDRTDRKKARLKYVLDAWGFEKFLGEVEGKARPAADARAAAAHRGSRAASTARPTSASTRRSRRGCLGRRGAAGRGA
jgi:ferredoxin-nitrite reductase